ncbi:MAG: hypothetical protein ACKPKO_06345, partial [Candidatus Fonsibacter sp.]
ISEFSSNRSDRKTNSANNCWSIYRVGFRNTAGGIESCESSLPYIDFTAPTVDYRSSILYEH